MAHPPSLAGRPRGLHYLPGFQGPGTAAAGVPWAEKRVSNHLETPLPQRSPRLGPRGRGYQERYVAQ